MDIDLSSSRNAQGRSDVKISPKYLNAACEDSQKVYKINKIVKLSVACPPTRTMVQYIPSVYFPTEWSDPRYVHKNRYTEHDDAETYVSEIIPYPTHAACVESAINIPAGTWWDRTTNSLGSKPLSNTLNCSKYGVPIQSYYGSFFVPKFALFDGTKFIKVVDTKVGIVETNGRISYSYNTTVDANLVCKKAHSLKKDGFQTVIPDCYGVDLKTKEYEIINSTNHNSIIWKQSIGGIYLFEARVLDPDYSFCELKTFFAVDVYGVPYSDTWQILLVVGFNIFGVIALAISYTWYSKSRKTVMENEGRAKKDQ